MKIWCKTVVDDKIILNKVERNELPLTKQNAFTTLQSVCHEMDIPTPMLTNAHYENFARFNFMKFKSGDFVESVDFDYLLVEYFI